jgi:protocatechuate 3,4-dioxygenase beta subunit
MLMAADPVHVGLVYLETDYLNDSVDEGADTLPDRFLLSFTGGAPDTELTELEISTDKDNDGLSVGDLIFDTALGGRGKEGAHPFEVVEIVSADPRASVTAAVEDGSQNLRLSLSHFRAGDTLEFSLDVDEVLRLSPDLDIFNDRLDVIASGQEFQDSVLTATFRAPHFEQAVGQDIFLNNYGDPAARWGLNLPPDVSEDPDSRPNRSAAAIAQTTQTPKPIAIAGTVFVDNNLDLQMQTGEAPLAGVELTLWRYDASSGSYLETGLTTTTDAAGDYEFGKSLGLMPGTYRVVQTQPAGYFSVGAIPGTVAGSGSGSVASADVLTGIEVPLGDLTAIDYDFAEAAPAEVSGFVFRDDSDDGLRDNGEVGIAGVRVRLTPVNTIASQAPLVVPTAADGSYRFAGLAPGSYRITELDQPAPYTDGLDRAGTVAGLRVGSAVNPGDRIEGVRLDGGAVGVEYNFGELPLGSISGFVFLPPPGEDCTSVDMGEAIPLAGVQIRLYDQNDTLVAETVTAADGRYRFDDVPKGTYRIEEITPADLIDGEPRVGTIDGIAVGSQLIDGSLGGVVLPAGRDGVDYDFCEVAPVGVSGYVYHDRSNEGRRDAGEEGIAGATVRLRDDSGAVVASTTTDAAGFYEFADLLPGSYTIEEVTPAGYLDGLDRAGFVAGTPVGSAANPGDRITAVRLKQGQEGEQYNFGELLPASIAGRVHADLDGDCTLDEGEQTLAGVTLTLFNEAGDRVAQTTTGSDGRYRFAGLAPGHYTVVQQQPEGYFSGSQKAGTTGGLTATINRIESIPVGSGETSLENDFCEHPPAELSGRVFADRDQDCRFDAGEPPLEGVRIELLDETGRVIETTFTNAEGRYQFSNLRRGRYAVRETQPVGYLHGGQKAGSGGGDDSQRDLIQEIEIGWGERLVEYDFCELEPSSLSGMVYVDSDGDCRHEPGAGERPLAGVTVRLHDSTGQVLQTTTTNAAGEYQFRNLRPGSYRVSELQPEGFFHGGQRVGSGGGRVLGDDLIGEIQIGANQTLVDYDFCEIEPAALGGMVFVDLNRDCAYQPEDGEHPLADVEVHLRGEDGSVLATTTTDSAGRYRFENLRPGRYQVFEVQPEGYYHGGQRIGSGGGRVLGDDLIGEIELAPGAELIGYDFCEVTGSSLSGRVWSDRSMDGRFDADELPLGGIRVDLLDNAGNLLRTAHTDDGGDYRFDDLAPGTYAVREHQPADHFHGGQAAGSHGGNDATRDLISAIEVPGSAALVRYDFPEIPPARISGYVFQDGPAIERETPPEPDELREYRDGRRTPDDRPLAGVTLELRNLFGSAFDSSIALPGTYPEGPIRVQTNAQGYYEFTGLLPRTTYHVYQVQPENFLDGLDTAGESEGSLAVNPADVEANPELQVLIRTLTQSDTTDPNNDAILRILVGAGEHSRFNNFSEIVVEPPTLGPLPETPRPQPVETPGVPLETFPTPDKLFLAATPPPASLIPQYRIIDDVSWHLSVINGGQPRGAGLDPATITVPVAGDQLMQRWNEVESNRGRWRLFDAAGETLELGRNMVIGTSTGQPLVGDFNGDGADELAIYNEGEWLIDLNANGRWDPGDLWVLLGSSIDRPVVGDWDGDGKDDVGIFGRQWHRDPLAIRRESGLPDPDNTRRRGQKNVPPHVEDATSGQRLLRKTARGRMRADLIDHVFRYGEEADIPLVGDWNGDGVDAIAVFQEGRWRLDANADGRWTDADVEALFGQPGDIPIVGDFNGDGIDELAVVRGDVWIIDVDGDRRLTAADLQLRIPRGADELPVAGDWDGDGRAEPGVYRYGGDEETPRKAI